MSGGENVVAGVRLLQHQPHAFNGVFSEAPVSLGLEIAQLDDILVALADTGQPRCDLTRDELDASKRAFVIEQNTGARKQTIRFAIVFQELEWNEVDIRLCDAQVMETPKVERGAPAERAVHAATLRQQEPTQIGAVLARDTRH